MPLAGASRPTTWAASISMLGAGAQERRLQQWIRQQRHQLQCAKATGSLDARQGPSTTSSSAAARSTTWALGPRPPWGNVLPDERMSKDKSETSLVKVFGPTSCNTHQFKPNFIPFSLDPFICGFYFYFLPIIPSFFSYYYCSYPTTTKSSSCFGCN